MRKWFGMADCKPVATLLEQGKKYQKLPDGSQPVKTKEYQAVIGSFTHAAIATRPNLSSAVGALSQFMSKPSSEHWIGVKRMLHYVKGTLDYGLKFEASSPNCLQL